jgi:hypothetical protein
VYLLSILAGSGVPNFPNENVVDVESLTVSGSCANKAELQFKNKTVKKSLLKYDFWLAVFKWVTGF